ncbi:NAD(P)/FAD-dependent oxidoreductase [Vannielia litorea]|uniref:NAD(P)/FAD-dependent oxidoreductase n=1 Tax=Vannielia litorea TaxID=1217970 RepID=UPI001C985BB4|nr:NAD(P)/FAD-dependent oxidoreductase [Vannielia litorea]MBY6048206.1 NAD(P)/FAD-dependent oxidoreductase [Vannielia litorea]MBY6075620.1 NAD(P)/FAD-dependent oxidoreductase [Vannielia litorea]
MTFDAIVIGGGPAGQSAALQLLRARRSVAIVDAGQPRNARAAHAQGFFTRDGTPPASLLEISRAQLEKYGTLEWVEGEAVAAEGQIDGFRVALAGGRVLEGRRLVLATGVKDDLPEVEGLEPLWGRQVFHCPYCHGYELEQGDIGVIGSSELVVHMAELITEWGEVTFLPFGFLPAPEQAAAMEARGVRVEEAALVRLEAGPVAHLADGRALKFDGLFAASRVWPASPIAEALGCAVEETPMGGMVAVDAMGATSVAGVFSCGDTAKQPHSIALAVGQGAFAGAAVHRSLVF